MILNFEEIPQANKGNGSQDTFELFSRDFFESLGYEILQHPDRGADGKKDLIIQETRKGISGTNNIKWLVSCKHYAHSGRSVSDMDEPNILDRVYSHGCDGFIGFYSTLPATSLSKNFDGLKAKINIQSFDREYIEKTLLESPQGLKLASRYFPTSFGKYKAENPQPVTIFTDEPRILCECCNKNLLEEGAGIFVILKKYTDCEEKETTTSLYEEAYFSCKGYCDVVLKEKYLKNGDYLDSWIDISDFLSPTHYLMRMMAWMNAMNLNNEKLEKAAFDKLKKLFINSFPHIAREQTTKEKEKIKHYLQNGWGDLL
ncbi:restriction endonuclease [Porphyromonas gulae]|uniref:restriction endonuclease n=1 Tax=Porphyromonas gulae TaxID=111105 RepID=UPI0009B8C7E4|nr:restriction endonuclease [Porphyromonas gulae]